jgi:hypothetical protein
MKGQAFATELVFGGVIKFIVDQFLLRMHVCVCFLVFEVTRCVEFCMPRQERSPKLNICKQDVRVIITIPNCWGRLATITMRQGKKNYILPDPSLLLVKRSG